MELLVEFKSPPSPGGSDLGTPFQRLDRTKKGINSKHKRRKLTSDEG